MEGIGECSDEAAATCQGLSDDELFSFFYVVRKSEGDGKLDGFFKDGAISYDPFPFGLHALGYGVEGCLKEEELIFTFENGVCMGFEVFDKSVGDEGEDEVVWIMLLLPRNRRDREGLL